ncbi:hypothetical protein BDZ94DRAFT_1338481, partial [Collybia nuda]
GTHSQNLEMYSAGFSPSIFRSKVESLEVVKIPEDSDVVFLLLRYMHFCPQPETSAFLFSTTERLAYAVEKYMIYLAMEVCRLRMELGVHNYPLAVLAYAVKHNYYPLAGKAAHLTLRYSFLEIEARFYGDLQVARLWLQYREGWVALLKSIHTCAPRAVSHKKRYCTRWDAFYSAALRSMDVLTFDPRNISTMPEIISHNISLLENCGKCATRATNWSFEIKRQRRDLPTFSTFLK